ncbi:N-acetylglucosamine-6-phosphate deacetylase [Mucilaginibacter mali]|uniref:N-acetylglucosamine-6-phosphate deacetylase n=1 Tax=Mucilaginibacter mali TaxID=2740462 RepID=A0A7D4UF97_9SPHI|nr:N-acetylglucosamine-6-phosphate deacetylase [Mucilaginibacter mali]QKJ32519.1 N-acetylglucosamine-6-phosphate deacetylase [Mucilaginibacter mali]
MQTAFHNAQIITNGETITGKAVLIANGKIAAILPDTDIPANAKRIDLNNAYLAPGLIDLQVYGSGGQLFSGAPSIEALHQMETDFLKQGTTGFLATAATNTNEVIERGILAGKAYAKQAIGNFLGLHIEGPYFNPKRKGAHPEEFIRKAALAEVKRWIEMGEGVIKMITLAPELQDEEVIDYLHSQGVIVSAGHTDASYEQASAFFDGRIKAATHLFNAMPQMHHRAPGIIPAIFEKQPYTSIVADGIHVSYPMIAMAKRQLGDKLFLITDAVTETNEGTHQHRLNGDHYVMNGTISGSALTMLKAIKNCVDKANISLPDAVNMASLYPARLAGLKDKGKIEAGYIADLLVFNNNFEVQHVVLNGELTSPR